MKTFLFCQNYFCSVQHVSKVVANPVHQAVDNTLDQIETSTVKKQKDSQDDFSKTKNTDGNCF